MPINIRCENGHELQVKDKLAGKQIRCPQCQAKVSIPAIGAQAPDDDEQFLEVIRERDLLADVRRQQQEARQQERRRVEQQESLRQNLILFAGSGGSLFLLTVLIGGWWAYGRTSPAAAPSEMAANRAPQSEVSSAEVADEGATPTANADDAQPVAAEPTTSVTPDAAPSAALPDQGADQPVLPPTDTSDAAVAHARIFPDPDTSLDLKPKSSPPDGVGSTQVPDFPGTLPLGGGPSLFSLDAFTGRVAAVDPEAKTLTIYRPRFFEGHPSEIDAFDIPIESPPTGVAFKRFRGHELLIVTAGKQLFVYDAQTLQLTTGNGQWRAVIDSPYSHLGLSLPVCSRDSEDGRIYCLTGAERDGMDSSAVFDLRMGGAAAGVGSMRGATLVSNSGRLLARSGSYELYAFRTHMPRSEIDHLKLDTLGSWRSEGRALAFDPYDQFLLATGSVLLVGSDQALPTVTHPLCAMQQRPWIVGVETAKERLKKARSLALHFCQRDTGQMVAELEIGDLARVEQAPDPHNPPTFDLPAILDDFTHDRLLVIRSAGVAVLPMKTVSLPDEPMLAASLARGSVFAPAEPASIAISCPSSDVKVSLVDAPEGMTLDENRLEWTPTVDQLGDHTLTLQLEHGPTLKNRTLDCTVAWQRLRLPFPFPAVRISADGQRALAWTTLPADSGNSVMALIDCERKQVLATREFEDGALEAVVGSDHVYVLGPGMIFACNRDDLSDVRQLHLGRPVTRLYISGDRILELRTEEQFVGLLELPTLTVSPLNELTANLKRMARVVAPVLDGPGAWCVGPVVMDGQWKTVKYFQTIPEVVSLWEATGPGPRTEAAAMLGPNKSEDEQVIQRVGFGARRDDDRRAGVARAKNRFVFSEVGCYVVDANLLGSDDPAAASADGAPPPLHVAPVDGQLILSNSEPTTLRYEASGGRPPYKYEYWASRQGWASYGHGRSVLLLKPLDDGTGVRVYGDDLASHVVKENEPSSEMALARVLYRGGDSDPAAAIDAYIQQANDRLQPWLGRELRGVPIAIPLNVSVTDANGTEAICGHSVILELRRNQVLNAVKKLIELKRLNPEAQAKFAKQDKSDADALPLILDAPLTLIDLSNALRRAARPSAAAELSPTIAAAQVMLRHVAVGYPATSAEFRSNFHEQRTYEKTDGAKFQAAVRSASSGRVGFATADGDQWMLLTDLTPQSVLQLWELAQPTLAEAQKMRQDAESRDSSVPIPIRIHTLGHAVQAFTKQYGCLPPQALVADDGRPLLSWRVILLPYLPNGEKLYRLFRLDEPWDSPHNIQLLPFIPDFYRQDFGLTVQDYPRVYYDIDPPQPLGTTGLLAVSGPDTMFPPGQLRLMTDVKDRNANILLTLFVGGRQMVEWTRPVDLDVSAGARALELISINRLPGGGGQHVLLSPVVGMFLRGAERIRADTDPALLFQAAGINDGPAKGVPSGLQ